MARNPYFTQGTGLERGLYEDLVVEQIKIYGQNVKYVPRSLVNQDGLFKEDSMSRFTGSYEVEMYVSDIEGFRGDGDLYSKFGIRTSDQVTFIVARKRFKAAVDDLCDLIVEGRPNEGDLIYFPLTQKLFEIKVVEYKKPFYQLENPLGAFVYELRCELFEYSHEDFETGDSNIDEVESEFGIVSTYTLKVGGTGNFQVGEILESSEGVTAEVAYWNPTTRQLKVSRKSGELRENDVLTGQTSNAIWTASGTYSTISFNSDELNMSMNKYFEDQGNMILDFSEGNPFGEYGNNDGLPEPTSPPIIPPLNPPTNQTPYFADLSDVVIDNLNSNTSGYVMVYDPETGKFKFVSLADQFGVNNDANPDPDIEDYGTF